MARDPALLAIVVFDGYDLIVYGTTLPSILAEPGCGLTATSAGLIGSLAVLGLIVGPWPPAASPTP